NLSTMTKKELHNFRNQKMGFIFQFHYLLAELTALENILMPAHKTQDVMARKDRALELLGEFGIRDKANSLPSQLSGGEQQRVAIARALIMQPLFLFADEPTGNLDSSNGLLVMNLLKKINKEHGTTIIYVTHDREFAGMASRQINLVDGKIVT
ncbi:MAG: ATP-binding cassette domain-containing protein, partial [Bdellovibrionota bacterium]